MRCRYTKMWSHPLLLIFVLAGRTLCSQDEKCDCSRSSRDELQLPPLSKILRVHPDSHQFIDELGRSRTFHGTNIVSKAAPYHPDLGGPEVCNDTLPAPLCDDAMDYLQGLGINVLRLGVMWPGAEPIRGHYNCTYFCVIHSIIQSMASRGIYTLIDVHQDVLARQFCQEGVPDWFVKKDWISNASLRFPYPQAAPFTTDENGIPEPWSQCWDIGADWFLSYFSVAVSDAFGRLYDNHDGLLDSFASYWRKIAIEFKDYKSVLGYNLLNEPWAGNIWADPSLLLPGVADRKNLERVWSTLNTAIRSVDQQTLVLFEGVTWDVSDGHTTVPGGDGSKTALSYHYYSPPALGLRPTFANRAKDMERLRTGGILTEFRMWAGEGDEDAGLIDKGIRETVEVAEEYLQSWIGWGYRSIARRDRSVARHYGRTYAAAVAGRLIQSRFNEDTGDFHAMFQIERALGGVNTEIRINKEIYYKDGYEVRVDPAAWLDGWDEDIEGTIRVRVAGHEGVVDGGNVTVRISPRDPTATTATWSTSSASSETTAGTTEPSVSSTENCSGSAASIQYSAATIIVLITTLSYSLSYDK